MIHFGGMRKKIWCNCYATLILGRRRQGKSTLLAMIAREAIKAGYTVYSNYPIDGAIKIPKVMTKEGKVVTDKSFLYNNPLLDGSFVLLDEVSNLWNNRSWGRWTEDDSDFFNFLGKNDTRVFLACQYYDTVDLNVKRSIDATWFVTKSIFPNLSIVECDYHDIVKVEDMQTRVVDSRYRKVTYEACEIPDGRYYFYRKKWYPYFMTLYKDARKVRKWPLEDWHALCFAEAPSPLIASQTPDSDSQEALAGYPPGERTSDMPFDGGSGVEGGEAP